MKSGFYVGTGHSFHRKLTCEHYEDIVNFELISSEFFCLSFILSRILCTIYSHETSSNTSNCRYSYLMLEKSKLGSIVTLSDNFARISIHLLCFVVYLYRQSSCYISFDYRISYIDMRAYDTREGRRKYF